jgi:large subunit ribosomal protein L3
MALGILGRKVGMTQLFDEKGNAISTTVIYAPPSVVVQIKDSKDGYQALQLGFEPAKEWRVTKPLRGHFKNVKPCKILREFRVDNPKDYKVGQEIKVDIFKEGERISISGNSKGRGFQGVMKRWGFSGGPKTHGSDFHRRPGSIGGLAATGKVFKGKKLPGRMGNKRVTVKNLVLKVDPQNNVIVVKGAVPGSKGSLLELRKEG